MWGIILLLVINVCICAADVGSTIGGTASLNCDVNGASFTWQKQYSASSWYPLTDVYKYEGGRTSRLTILNFQQNDVGIYRCYGHDVNGNFVDYGSEITVVVVSPTVSIKYNYYYGEIGQSFTIPCVTGDSFAVQWKKVSSSGTQVINLASAKYTGGTFTTPSLTITNILSSDGGDYQCCGTNVYGQSCDQTTLIPGNQPALSRNLKTVIAKISTNVVLGVTITSSTPALLSVYWKKDSQYIYGNRYNGGTTNISSLTINNVVATDDGTYTCTIYNGVGTASVDMNLFTWNTPSVFLNGNQNVAVGSVAVIQCRITSKPDVKRITWKKETVPINFSNDTKYQTSG